jgi:hypothetical protein
LGGFVDIHTNGYLRMAYWESIINKLGGSLWILQTYHLTDGAQKTLPAL